MIARRPGQGDPEPGCYIITCPFVKTLLLPTMITGQSFNPHNIGGDPVWLEPYLSSGNTLIFSGIRVLMNLEVI